jgi:two-component system sensor histidine kinase KdpD
MNRGTLRIYLGAAPGVGKTFAMLDEGHRRLARGTDVVVGVVEDHGRPRTAELVQGFEVVPRRTVEHRGARLTEMDLDALLARHPKVALVDELAHTNAPGSRNAKRWQDVDELLEAGIDVISTVNVQHLESLNDVVEQVTGVTQREVLPDSVVRRADQVDLVDMSPEALRRRMAHGNVYPADRVDAALGNYFRVGNLTALRELALLWLADKVDEGLQKYRHDQGIDSTWETRERVAVALTGGPEGETLLRRGARIAGRTGGDLLAVHVARGDGLQGASSEQLATQRALVESLGGSYHLVVGDDLPTALLDFARAENATQLVLGASRRRWTIFGGTGQTVVRRSGSIDVHLVTHEHVGRGRRLPELTGGLTPRRRAVGALGALGGLPLLTLLLASLRDSLGLPSILLLYLLAVIGVALVGGLYPALLAAVGAGMLANYYFTPPLYTFTITDADNVVALLVFVVVAIAVSSVVDLAARRTRQASRARAEAETLAALSGDVLRGERTLTSLVERLREAFGLAGVDLLDHDELLVASGTHCPDPQDLPIAEALVLRLHGDQPSAGDLRVLKAFVGQLVAAVERNRLRHQAAEAEQLAQVDRLRTSLLAAVGHDLRTPLSVAKATITSLRGHDVTWSSDEQEELLATAETSLDQLDALVSNLLDMSRLQAGVLAVQLRPVALDESVPIALRHLPDEGKDVELDVPEELPEVLVDPGLLERVVVNLLQNAQQHSPAGKPVRVSASQLGDRVELRVVDHGPGIVEADRDRVFQAFQRLDDRATSSYGAGVGLGLAVARGFLEAMGGTLTADDTPGGGLTMTLSLPIARTS